MIQGVGRHSAQEVDQIAKKDLTALSTFLGSKPYFFGNKPTTLDATAFGLLTQLLYTPLNGSEIKKFMEQSTPNLVQFTERIKSEYWPDWQVTLIQNKHSIYVKQKQQVLITNLVMNANDPVVGSKHHA
ncbi:hypothetical protein M3Y94_00555100 [Aphelenchoides besseyi]|nr:hypothetical protein M3Y94_00555100 [Aphelenchoides besseyi]